MQPECINSQWLYGKEKSMALSGWCHASVFDTSPLCSRKHIPGLSNCKRLNPAGSLVNLSHLGYVYATSVALRAVKPRHVAGKLCLGCSPPPLLSMMDLEDSSGHLQGSLRASFPFLALEVSEYVGRALPFSALQWPSRGPGKQHRCTLWYF